MNPTHHKRGLLQGSLSKLDLTHAVRPAKAIQAGEVPHSGTRNQDNGSNRSGSCAVAEFGVDAPAYRLGSDLPNGDETGVKTDRVQNEPCPERTLSEADTVQNRPGPKSTGFKIDGVQNGPCLFG